MQQSIYFSTYFRLKQILKNRKINLFQIWKHLFNPRFHLMDFHFRQFYLLILTWRANPINWKLKIFPKRQNTRQMRNTASKFLLHSEVVYKIDSSWPLESEWKSISLTSFQIEWKMLNILVCQPKKLFETKQVGNWSDFCGNG